MSRLPACLILAGLLNALPLIPVAAQPAPDQYGDPLPPGARARLGTVRFREGGPVAFVAFSPDGKVLASSMGNGSFQIWEAATGRRLRRLPGQLQGPASAAFSPDGKALVLVGGDGRVRFVDAATGKELRRLTTPAANRWQVAFSPDGKTVALLDSDQSLRLWDVAADKERHRLLGPPAPVKGGPPGFAPSALAFSADGQLLALGGMQGKDVVIRVWEVFTGRERPALTGPQVLPGNLSYLGFSPDGKMLWVGDSQQGRMYLLNAVTGAKLRQLAARRTYGQPSAAFSPNGKLLAVVNGEGVDLVDPATGQTVRRLPCPGQGFACLAFTADGKTLAVGGADHILHLWDVATGKEIRPPQGHRGAVAITVYSPDGRTVATVGSDHTVHLWDPATAKELRRLARPLKAEDVNQLAPPLLAFLRGGRVLAAAWSDGVICAWETATGKRLARVDLWVKDRRPLAFSHDGQALATLGADGQLRIQDVLSGRELRRFPGPQSGGQPGARALVVAFGPDGRTLATADSGPVQLGRRLNLQGGYIANVPSAGLVRLWELTSGRERGQVALARGGAPFGQPWGSSVVIDDGTRGTILFQETASVSRLALAPDGRTLAAIFGNSLRLVDLESNRELRRLDGGFFDGGPLAFSPDGRMLAQGGHAGVTFWDVATGEEVGRLTGHLGTVTAVAFSPDGKVVLTGAADTTALVWDVRQLLEEGRRRRVEPSPQRLEELWKELAAADAARAHRAVWALAAAPARSVPYLGARLRPVPDVDGKRLARLVAELNHGRYAVRQQAVRDLEALGDVAEVALRAALEDGPTLELRRRVEPLLEKLEGPVTAPELLRALRAVEALERAGTAEARAVLARLAGGAPPARLTREAQDALKRLEQRSSSPRP
jgi:WD40 repeat protein